MIVLTTTTGGGYSSKRRGSGLLRSWSFWLPKVRQPQEIFQNGFVGLDFLKTQMSVVGIDCY